MAKKILFTIYIISAALSVYIFGIMAQTLSKISPDFTVNFITFEIGNPIALLTFLLITIIAGSLNLILANDSGSKISTYKISEEEATEIKADEINENIRNEYEARVGEIALSISEKAATGKDKKDKLENALWELCKQLAMGQGLIYQANENQGTKSLEFQASYAFMGNIESIRTIEFGVGVTGQVAKTGEFIYLKDVPKGYMKIVSGLGETSPDYLIITPVKKNNEVLGMVEIAGIGQLNTEEVKTIKELVQGSFLPLLAR